MTSVSFYAIIITERRCIIIVILGIIILILIIYNIYTIIYNKNIIKQKTNEINILNKQIETNKNKLTEEEHNKLIQELEQIKNQQLDLIEKEIEQQQNTWEKKKQDLEQLITCYDKLVDDKKKNINSNINKYKEIKQREVDFEINQYYKKLEEEKDKELNNKIILIQQKLQEEQNIANEKINTINLLIEEQQKKLDEYNKTVLAANEAILRLRELTENENFYKINLTEEEISDILYTKELKNHFINSEFLQKAIYECYYKKPLNELFKRVLQNEEFSGIYKITSLKTKEAYIGRAVNIKKRWTDHIKSSMGIGSLVSSVFHKRIAADGCWNFTFEVLEKVEKDKLNEREAYWIDYYQTNIYGLNSKKGG